MTEYLGECCIDSPEACPNPATRMTDRGPMCDAHRKRLQPSREGGASLTDPLQKRLGPRERLRECALEYAEAGEDLEYARAEGDLDAAAEAMAKQRRAGSRLDKAAESYGSILARRRTNESIAEGLARAKAAGLPVGRPRKVTSEVAVQAVAEEGSIKAAAHKLGAHYNTVRKALKTTLKFKRFRHKDMHDYRPRLPGDSEKP